MAFVFLSSSTLLAFGVTFVALVLLYRAALPKPIRGIPYNHASARSILGDIPSMIEWKNETRETFIWMTLQCQKLNSPIVQIFAKPFSKPWVVIVDARECQDVLIRRSKEFDRASFTTDVVQPILREHFFPMPSGTKQRAHRALLSDTMTPAFLNKIAAPQLYEKSRALLQLWRKKSSLANGHPFAADEDIGNTALDTIWAAAVGSEAKATQSQLDSLANVSAIQLPTDHESSVDFPHTPTPYDVRCIRTVVDTMEVGLSSPLPGLSYWFYTKIPRVRKAFSRKDMMLATALQEARDRLEKDEFGTEPVKSAMDYILRREILQARTEQRAPQLDAVMLMDELFGFLLAGHETTSTTMNWGLKFLTDHQDVQEKLRQTMREAMPDAVAAGREPFYSEITAAHMPYFEAVVEEILRCGVTAAAQARMCLVDTELLGIPLKKGTNVLFMTNGPSFVAPSMHIDEHLRSRSSQAAKDKVGEWDPMDVSKFKPERWLKTDSEGKVGMDFHAGPTAQFGGGPRGCFGKRFAYLEMRIIMTMVFWNFKLLPVSTELSSYRAFDCVTHRPEQCYIRLTAAS